MKSTLAITVMMLTAAAPALADNRDTVVSIGGLAGAQGNANPSEPNYGVGGARLTLSFEHAPLPYPVTPGYSGDFTFVPELVAGVMFDSQRAQGQLGVGGRLELRMSQREMGLMKVSARAGFYVGGHALVVGDNRDVVAEVTLGEYIYLGRTSRVRIGFEGDFQFGTNHETATPNQFGDSGSTTLGALGQLYISRPL